MLCMVALAPGGCVVKASVSETSPLLMARSRTRPTETMSRCASGSLIAFNASRTDCSVTIRTSLYSSDRRRASAIRASNENGTTQSGSARPLRLVPSAVRYRDWRALQGVEHPLLGGGSVGGFGRGAAVEALDRCPPPPREGGPPPA